MKKIIVAIDGFSSCGKSTMAKDLAKDISYTYIDSGAMYRAVTLYALQNGCFNNAEVDEGSLLKAMGDIKISFEFDLQTGHTSTYLNEVNVESAIRMMEVADRVSSVASLSFVRTALVRQQQAMGCSKGIVMDGRDIGTVVFPQAELKIFVTASPETRAQRRFDELKLKGVEISYEEILKNVLERDRMDVNRQDSPLKRADDAIELDNTHLTILEQQTWLLNQFNRVVEGK